MFTLALDCSFAVGSLCILQDSKILVKTGLSAERSQGESLVLRLKETLNQSGIKLEALSRIVVTRGPGRFTGIRVGLNLAKSLSYALNIPILAMDSLTALACQTHGESLPVITMVNAFRDMVFFSKFHWVGDRLNQEIEGHALPVEQVESLVNSDCLCLGDAYELFSQKWSPRLKSMLVRSEKYGDFVDVTSMAEWVDKLNIVKTNWKDTLPLYLKGSEAEERLKAGLLKPVEELYKLK